MNPSRALLFPVLISLLASACPKRDAKPVAKTDASASEPGPASLLDSGADRAPVSVVHTVLEGQTLWDIARAYGVSVQDIMETNQLRPRDIRRISRGAHLEIPGKTEVAEVETAADRAARQKALPRVEDGAYHFLCRGESVWTLARLYNVKPQAIIERNGFSDDDLHSLREGSPVIIPGIDKSKIKQSEPKKRSGIVHEVVRGENIWDIARAFQVSMSEIMAANGLSSDSAATLKAGTRLLIPGVEEDKGGRLRRIKTKMSARERRAALVAERLGLGTRKAAGELLHGRVKARWIRAAGSARRLPGTLRWPVVNGWFVRGYGSGEGGYHLAVDIMGKIGWNVRAAARGIVAYSGDELRGFGKTVLVIHPGGWVTLYAHNSVNFVVAGEKVPRGGVLAELGATGIARGPHVHFELIHDGKNCDPARLFRPGVRHRNSKLSRLRYTTWRIAGKRPESVRCAPRRRHPRSKLVVHEAWTEKDEQTPDEAEQMDEKEAPPEDGE